MTYLTRDDFIRIACEAGIDKYLNTNGHLIGNLLERFGQKVVHEIKKEWEGLTDEEREEIALELPIDAVRITEAKLKEKNGMD